MLLSIKNYVFVLLSLLLTGCQSAEQKTPPTLVPAFYYWQTTYAPTASEQKLLRQLPIQKLYIRFFDVDWDTQRRQPIPKAFIRFSQRPTVPVIVPVVFITNRTLQHLSATSVSSLARNIVLKTQQIAEKQGIRPAEIQLDCDWTGTTRETYFALLRHVRKETTAPLSATIRLHQIKYVTQTGVPPVDRGMLMFYNMADWKRQDTRNSIYDLDMAKRYTAFLDRYPLPLDMVMPLFRWTVVYRNNRFLTFLNNLDRSQLKKQPFLQMQADTNRFIARRDTTALGFSIRKGDLFRAEACSPTALQTGKELLMSKISAEKSTFALFHLDSLVLQPYNYAFLKSFLGPVP